MKVRHKATIKRKAQHIVINFKGNIMKNTSIFLQKTALLSLVFIPALITYTAQASDIELEISGINSNNGKIYIQLFQGEENYQQGKPAAATFIKAQKGSSTVMFNNIEKGEYAIRLYHDENDNGELETNLFGMPVEGYAFSNNAKPNFGPAAYDDMKFQVTEENSKVVNKTTIIY